MSPLRFQALARDRCYVFPTCRDVGITFSRFGAKQCIGKESLANRKKHTEAHEAAKNFEAQQQAHQHASIPCALPVGAGGEHPNAADGTLRLQPAATGGR